MRGNLVSIFSFAVILLTGCGGGSDEAPGNPPPGNTASIVSVGKKIFFDTNLSSNGTQSCASCHDPAAGFADPDVLQAAPQTTPVSEGAEGVFGNRNAPTAAYAIFSPSFRTTTTAQTSDDLSKYEGGQFLDGRSVDLIEQAKAPFLNPVEMNNTDEADVVNKVRNSSYASDFLSVFGANAFDDTMTAYNNIATAIAAFEASPEVNPFSSKFDAVQNGTESFTAPEQRGFNLFRSNTAKCANCHVIANPTGGPALFTNFKYFNVGTPINVNNPAYIADNNFRDNGMGGRQDFAGTADETGEQGKFKTPTLRNIELTAPYMHNGRYGTLEEVVNHYDIFADGNITPEVNTNIAPELTTNILGFQGSDVADLVAFMKTLTDR